MFDQYPALAQVVDVFTTAILVIIGILAILCLIRSILGPKVADRIVAVNMLGTMVMVMIATLAVKLNEGFLADICLIYAMISFLAVIVGTRIYMESYLEKMEKGDEEYGSNRLASFFSWGCIYVNRPIYVYCSSIWSIPF